MFPSQDKLFDDFIYNGVTYRPLAIVCESRAKATAEMFRKLFGYTELLWIPCEKSDGYICFELK